MMEIEKQVQELVRAMQNSPDYRKYRRLEDELSKNPELKQQIDTYRRRAFEMASSNRDIFEETDTVLKEFSDLLSNIQAVEYLDAESAVCCMIRQVMNDISEALPVEVPF